MREMGLAPLESLCLCRRAHNAFPKEAFPSLLSQKCSPAFPEKILCSQARISVLLLPQPLLIIFMSSNVTNHTALLSILALQMGETADSNSLLH